MAKKSDKKLSSVLADLKADYLRDLPRKIERLRTLTEANNWAALYDEYHKLKGTGKTYGFPEISQLCERLEHLSQKKESQKQSLFLDAIRLLEVMQQTLQKGESFELTSHPLGRTLLGTGKPR